MKFSYLVVIIVFLSAPTDAQEQFEILIGPAIGPYMSTIKGVRAAYYRQFPYLYVSPSIEKEDTSYYEKSNKTLLIILRINDNIAGLMIGLPLDDFKFQKDFLGAHEKLTEDLGTLLNKSFYISELLIVQGYDDKTIKDKLLKIFEENIFKSLEFSSISVMTILRDDYHPLRPQSYEPEYKLYEQNNYDNTTLTYSFRWPVLQVDGSIKEQDDHMLLWIKKLP